MSFFHLRLFTIVSAVAVLTATGFSQEQLNLSARQRTETEPGSGRFHSLTTPVTWRADRTALVICDMWDKHWCPNATKRVGQMAPRMNEVVSAARRKGVLIIHCPSDTMDFYKDWPQRRLAQAAPPIDTKIPLQRWCHLDSKVEGAALPIDDSDGGCDCDEPVKNYRAWSRQHPAIEIAEQDAITDSEEAFYLMKQRGIENVIVMGVHTNMCVLGRPFSIRQMVQQGQNVVLMRDMTDTMYNPNMAPFVSHFTGTDLVVEHIEHYWCPTVLSTDLIGGSEFRFEDDHRSDLAILCAEQEYETKDTLRQFAGKYLGQDFRVHFVWDAADDRNSLPGIEVLRSADAVLISVRRRTLPHEQLQIVRDFVASGKPVIGIRTASHAFSLRNEQPPEGHEAWPEFDADVFGGHYTNHHGDGPNVSITPASDSVTTNPILSGIDVSAILGNGSLYKVSPLQPSATALLTGTIPNADPEPVAWVNQRSDGGRSFYTSLGHPDDFQSDEFCRMLQQAITSLAKPARR
ncbi:MAG: isochorismatase family protein [Planctomycetaceae bacterium]